MPVKTLSDKDKHGILLGYVQQNLTQDELAEHYQVSRKTIYRVLIEKGALPERQQLTKKQQTLLDVLYKHQMTDPDMLEEALTMPALTAENVTEHLLRLNQEALTELFWYLIQAKSNRERQAEGAAQGLESVSQGVSHGVD